jgi:hypothetical protein
MELKTVENSYQYSKLVRKVQRVQPNSHPINSKGNILPDQVRDAIRTKHYSYRTEQTFADRIKRFTLFHVKRHPRERGT